MNRPSALRAFTLIELLVVIAIIAILAAILFPVFSQAKESAKHTAELSQAKQIGTGLQIYLADHDDMMPIFYAYNSQPPAGQPGHKGVEVLLFPYIKSRDLFKSPFDRGGPYTSQDVPGAKSYFEAYGSSYRFTQCLYTMVEGESSSNNQLADFSRSVSATQLEFPSESRVMRLEMLPWFSNRVDTDCSRYGYDCPAPANYYTQWSGRGGSVVFADTSARLTTSAGAFDQQRISVDGRRSGEPSADSWSGTWYGLCD